ncbi:MAG: Stk1 family PASTA domain-containing Ser/Thr kinase [Lactobacillus sp.]
MINKGYLLGDRYRIVDSLGEGGMANVYLAEDIILHRKVAVKMLREDLQKADPGTIKRFQREALATSELSHPNIVSVFDVASWHGIPYMVMEYVAGPNLKEYIQKNKPLSLKRVIAIMDQILSAVFLAHKHNVIHRDLKPQNILLDQKGNAKIADFGIALAMSETELTRTNTALGSVHYMSPEQTRGGVVTKQSDIYSLGIILYEMITGEVPFSGETAVSVALKHMRDQIPSVREQNPAVPQALENVILQATAKDPRDRYDSVADMKRALDISLSPSQAGVKPFVPQHDPSKETTIVLPQFHGEVTSTEKVPEEVDVSAGKPRQKWRDSLKKHKWWWLISTIAVICILGILALALSASRTSHVPTLVGMSERQARLSLRTAGLKIGQVEQKHSSRVKKGHVIETKPRAGVKIRAGHTVTLVVSTGPAGIKMPDLTDRLYEDARQTLLDKGFQKVRRVRVYSNTVAEDHVIDQDPDPGSRIKHPSQNTAVLTVSRGRRRVKRPASVRLRDLTGYTLKGAQDYARDSGLRLEISQKEDDSAPAGTVLSQSPAAGKQLQRGATVQIVVAQKSKTDNTDNDNVTRNITVTYNPDEDQRGQGNHVRIYISDDSHSLDNLYRDLYIKSDQTFSIPFSLKNGAGHLRVLRDDDTIYDESVDHD